jgi:hypothetical protein
VSYITASHLVAAAEPTTRRTTTEPGDGGSRRWCGLRDLRRLLKYLRRLRNCWRLLSRLWRLWLNPRDLLDSLRLWLDAGLNRWLLQGARGHSRLLRPWLSWDR